MATLTLDLPAAVARRMPDAAAYEAAVDAMINVLRDKAAGKWPVDTGRSLRAWRRIGSGYASQAFNPLRYASFAAKRARWRWPAGNNPRLIQAGLAAAGRELRTRAGTRSGILSAARRRREIETAMGRYRTYLEHVIATDQRRRRPVRIPAWLRAADREIREQAA